MKIGVATFVILSLLETPLSLAAVKSGAVGTLARDVSITTANAADIR